MMFLIEGVWLISAAIIITKFTNKPKTRANIEELRKALHLITSNLRCFRFVSPSPNLILLISLVDIPRSSLLIPK